MKNLQNKGLIKLLVCSLHEQNLIEDKEAVSKHLFDYLETYKSQEKINLPNACWGPNFPIIRVNHHLEASDDKGFTNGRYTDCPQDLEEAIEHYSKLRNKGDEYDDLRNSYAEVITKVTVITEIQAIVYPEDKK